VKPFEANLPLVLLNPDPNGNTALDLAMKK